MKYKCRNCKKEFDFTAWYKYTPTITYPPMPQYVQPSEWPYAGWPYTGTPTFQTFTYEVIKLCCPFCHSLEIEETKE